MLPPNAATEPPDICVHCCDSFGPCFGFRHCLESVQWWPLNSNKVIRFRNYTIPILKKKSSKHFHIFSLQSASEQKETLHNLTIHKHNSMEIGQKIFRILQMCSALENTVIHTFSEFSHCTCEKYFLHLGNAAAHRSLLPWCGNTLGAPHCTASNLNGGVYSTHTKDPGFNTKFRFLRTSYNSAASRAMQIKLSTRTTLNNFRYFDV